MNPKIEALAAELETIRTEIAELDAVEEPTEEQAQRAEQLLSDWDAKKAEHDRLVERAEKVEAIRSAHLDRRNVERTFEAPQVSVKRDAFDGLDAIRAGFVGPQEMRSRALTAIETVREEVPDSYRERATQLCQRDAGIARHVLLTGSPAYRSAFEKFLADGAGFAAYLTHEEREAWGAARTAMSTTVGNGGYLLPFLLDPTIVLTGDGSANPFRQISRVEVGTSNKWNGVTSAGVTTAWKGENSAYTDGSPTTAQPSITAITGTAFVKGSLEIFADSNIAAQLPRLIQDSKDDLEAAAFATGVGSTSAPKGIVTAVTAVTASRVSPTTGGTFSAVSEVYNVINAVPPRHRSMSSWVANYTTFNTIRSWDVYGGSSFWADLSANVPANLLGRPVYEASSMTATVTTGSNILLAGNFAEYLIYDRAGVSVEFVQNVVDGDGVPTGTRGYLAWWRVGADALNANAFRILKL